MSSPTVFVIDDDLAIRKSLSLLVQSVKLPVESFETAQEFLDVYDPSRSGCLVLDLRMPGLSGLELQQRLAARSIRIPIIFISGHGDLASAVGAMRAGALDFLEKPIRGQVLLDRMAAGKPYKVIARELGVSYKAVEGRRARIMRKMRAENLSELLRRVLTYQLTSSSC